MMKKVPKRRFKGFLNAGDWEQRKLGDLLILLKDGSHGTHKNTDEGVYLLSAKNIKNGRINIMPDDRIISWEDYDVIHKNYELQVGDILLTIVGSIGETAIFNLKTKVTFQRSVAFLRPDSDLNNGFLYTLINTDRFQNQLQTKQVVSAQPGIYLGDLASIDITYPKNLSEQEKIYSIFKEIENSITLHQRKLEKLQATKKALLYELFPIENSRRPKRRFKGFTGDWEQRKLGELVTVFSGRDYKHLSEGDIPVYGTGGYMLSVNEALSNDQDAIGIGRKGTIDKPYILKAPFWTVDTLFYAIPKEEVDLNFIFCIFKNVDWRKLDESTGVPSLSKTTITNVDVYCPLFEEQLIIGQLFSWIDRIITLHQRKLEKLKNLKAAYLNEMFV